MSRFHYMLQKYPLTSPHTLMGSSNWKQSPPMPGVHSSPSGGVQPPNRSAPGSWDVFDAPQREREAKQSRTDDALAYDSSHPPSRLDEKEFVLDEQYGMGQLGNSGTADPLGNIHSNNRVSPVGFRQHHSSDYIWRDILAKGGTPICRARCVPIVEGIGYDIRKSSLKEKRRTDGGRKNKCRSCSVSRSDSEEDFTSYTEFLQYLGSKDRAWVAKFDDGTTLFLVPPSDFLTKVLKVFSPGHLYGVVLKFAHQIPSGTSLQLKSHQPQYVDAPQITSLQATYDAMPPAERVSQMDYSQVAREDLKLPSKTVGSDTDTHSMNPVLPNNTGATIQAGVTLTPELIATLAKMLPANKSPNVEGAAVPTGASAGILAPDVAFAPDQVQQTPWRYKHHAQVISRHPAHPSVLSTPYHCTQGATSFSQMQDHSLNLQTQGAPLSKPLKSTILSQGMQLPAWPYVDQPLQLGALQNPANGSGVAHETDTLRLSGSCVLQKPTNHPSLSNPIHCSNISHSQAGKPFASDMELPTQVQQLQSVLCSPSHLKQVSDLK